MCSPSPPPAPDYTAAANATAEGNLDAARLAAKSNRVNQYTPYGSVEYYNPTSNNFNQAAYDAAMDQYYKSLSAPAQQTTAPTSGIKSMFNQGQTTTTSAPSQSIAMPNREDFMTGYDPDIWASRVTLSPEQQQLLDKQNQASLGLADTFAQGVGYVQDVLNNRFDQSNLPRQMVNADQTGQDAIMARLDPQIQQDRQMMASNLANQGITQGSEAWQNAMRQQGNQENDLRTQAALQGIGIGNQARQQAIQEQSFFRNEPINTLNAVRTGAQVQNPQFTNTPQQATTQGPDLLGAAGQQYNAALGAYNAKQAGSNNLMSGLFGLGSAFLM